VAEVREFVQQLARHGVKYVFLHVGPIESDGFIPVERYSRLGEFLSVARTYGDRIVFLPWMGQLRSKLPLDRIEVRRNIVSTSKRFIEEYGMAGLHLDIEPIVSGDSDFLFLLEDLKMAMGSDKILSIALEEYVPHALYRLASKFIEVNPFLSIQYVKKIDALADQIAIMTYENSIRSPSLYRYFVRQEVIWMSRVLTHARLLIGLPTYDKASPTFYPEAENIRNGLLGVVDGLNSWKMKRGVFEGVSLYGSWTTDDREWKTFHDLFISQPLAEK
jgi:hypothetical protein